MISGNAVTIRPVLSSEIEQFVSLKNLSVLMDEYAIPIMESPQAILNEFYINGLVAEDFETYVLTDSGNRIIGSVHAFCPSIYRSSREIGIIIFDIQDRSRGYGKEAVRLFLGYLLAREGVNRVQMTIPIHNSASRRIAERLGLQLEGVAKKMVHLKNGFHDCAIYAITK